MTSTRPRVLLLAQDSRVREYVRQLLLRLPYQVCDADNLDDAAEIIYATGQPILALIAFPDEPMSGMQAARELKDEADLPLIMIAAADALDAVMLHVRTFADDFLLMPLQASELAARIDWAMARTPAQDYDRERMVELEGVTIDFARSRLIVNGKSTRLSPIESGLLHLLMRNAPRVVDSGTLLRRVWAREGVTEDILRVHIHRLRTKLESDPHHPRYLLTERGVGYRFSKRTNRA